MAIYFDLTLILIQHYYFHQNKWKEVETQALLPHYRAFYMHFQELWVSVCFDGKDLLTIWLSSTKIQGLRDNSSKSVGKSSGVLH